MSINFLEIEEIRGTVWAAGYSDSFRAKGYIFIHETFDLSGGEPPLRGFELPLLKSPQGLHHRYGFRIRSVAYAHGWVTEDSGEHKR